MIQQPGQGIVSGLLLGVMEKLQILDCGAGLGDEGDDKLFVHCAELVCAAVGHRFVGKREVPERLVMASNLYAEK